VGLLVLVLLRVAQGVLSDSVVEQGVKTMAEAIRTSSARSLAKLHPPAIARSNEVAANVDGVLASCRCVPETSDLLVGLLALE